MPVAQLRCDCGVSRLPCAPQAADQWRPSNRASPHPASGRSQM